MGDAGNEQLDLGEVGTTNVSKRLTWSRRAEVAIAR